MTEIERAKSILIQDFLSSIGINPQKETARLVSYLSPLRAENNPSFIVKKKTNKWFDHGTRAHGDLIDFVEAYEGVSKGKAIQMINGDRTPFRKFDPEEADKINKEGIMVDSVGAIINPPLLDYLKERCITESVAQHHCVQVKWRFTVNPASCHFGIGFRNDSDGLEIRNSQFKVSNSPKTYRTIGEYTPVCNVFEGFFDYMSALSENKTLMLKNRTYVLNGLAFIHIMTEIFLGHEKVNVFIDNGPAADDKINVMRDSGIVVEDMRHLFQGKDDYNEYWINKHKNN